MNRNMNRFMITIMICIGLVITGCSSGPSVKRESVEKVIDLSGKWNDTDSRLVSDEMIHDSLARPWLDNFKSSHKGKNPVVIVGTVRNKSHEHINIETFTKDLQRALINSGNVDFVENRNEDATIREERKQQQQYSSEDTAKREGNEIGADYILQGSINTIEDKIEGRYIMYYQTNLDLIDISTHKIVWSGEKKIKKDVSHAGSKL